QYEQYQFRKGKKFGNLDENQLKYIRQGLPQTYLAKPVSPINGIINPETAKLYYPQVGQYGTDLEAYYDAKVGKSPAVAPVTTNATLVTPMVYPDKDTLRKKYGGNPYLADQNRYNWGNKLQNEFPLTGGKVKDAVVDAAKFNGVDPALLYSSAMEEGMSGSVDAKYSGNASEAYVDWAKKNNDIAEEYPVDSFYNYGLDQFSGMASGLEKKGYLPKGFKERFTTFPAENEKGEQIKASAFKKDSDALIAKSAMMRLAKDQLNDHLSTNNVKLTPKQQEFFLLANYNGGEGLMKKMLQSYKEKGYLKDDKFLDPKFKPASYGEVYKHVLARLESAKQLKEEKYFEDDKKQSDFKSYKIADNNNSSDIRNDETVNNSENESQSDIGPISFLNSYYESPEFKRKSGGNYEANKSIYKKGAQMYVPKIVESDKEGSHSVGPDELFYSKRFEEKGSPTVVLDKKQAKDLKYDLFNDVLPHEYAHTTRRLSPNDEQKFILKNKNNLVKTLFESYKQDSSGMQSGKTFSDWAHTIADHTQLPGENYSDLNSLRWNLYKAGIYDARKGQMNVEHLKKAMSDPKLKDNELFNRLLKSFSPEDIVELNNTVASTKPEKDKEGLN